MEINASTPSPVLGRVETYLATQNIWPVKQADDIIKGIPVRLSNMFKGFPFMVAGREWADSERLYLLGEYSLDTPEHQTIQSKLISYKSGYAAKRFGKSKYKKMVREDFAEFRLQWMLWVVWQKVKGNKDFQRLLLSIPEDVTIIENTTTDTGGTAEVWGCRNKELVAHRKNIAARIKAENGHLSKKDLGKLLSVELNKIRIIGIWTGQNNIGKFLAICRNCIIYSTEPKIDYSLLRSKKIHILGQLLTFED